MSQDMKAASIEEVMNTSTEMVYASLPTIANLDAARANARKAAQDQAREAARAARDAELPSCQKNLFP